MVCKVLIFGLVALASTASAIYLGSYGGGALGSPVSQTVSNGWSVPNPCSPCAQPWPQPQSQPLPLPQPFPLSQPLPLQWPQPFVYGGGEVETTIAAQGGFGQNANQHADQHAENAHHQHAENAQLLQHAQNAQNAENAQNAQNTHNA